MLQSSMYNAWHEIRIQPTVTTFIFVFASVYTYRYSMSFIAKFFKKNESLQKALKRFREIGTEWALGDLDFSSGRDALFKSGNSKPTFLWGPGGNHKLAKGERG